MKIFNSIKNIFKKDTRNDFKSLVEKELLESKSLLESLRDYDEGKKDISTADLERSLPNIRVSTRP